MRKELEGKLRVFQRTQELRVTKNGSYGSIGYSDLAMELCQDILGGFFIA